MLDQCRSHPSWLAICLEMLNRNYVIENGRRVFKKIRCKLLCSGQAVSSRYYDGEHPVVFLDR